MRRAAAAERRRDRLDARREGGIGLVGEAVIVLDVIDAAGRKAARQIAELCRRHALRLERRAGQSALACANAAAQFG